MNPTSYKAARETILQSIESANEVVQNLRIKDGAFFSEIPSEAQRRFVHIEREITRLRQPNLTVAFVGGFSAGKSSLVNAFLGRYLLPESTEVTTAVPTFIRSTGEKEFARLSYLSKAEVETLEELYRESFANKFKQPELANMPTQELLEQVRPQTSEGKGKNLLQYFEVFLEEKKRRDLPDRGLTKDCSLEEMAIHVRDEKEAMFLDRVEVFVNAPDIPSDVQLVDLPGISVPNPRHERLTYRFVTQDAHALIFVLRSTQLFNQDELDILERIRSGESSISDKTFWVLNRWDALSEQQQAETLIGFQERMKEYSIPDSYVMVKTNALHGLLSQLAIRGVQPNDAKLKTHQQEYEKELPHRYGGDHRTAFKESEIDDLQREVLDYLNNRIRSTTLRSAVDNSQQNLVQPLLHHLSQKKRHDEQLVHGALENEQAADTRTRTEMRYESRKSELMKCFKSLRDGIAVSRGEQFADGEDHISIQLRAEIDSGNSTDAYEVYKSIIADNRLRTFPYYFEIEMKVVDGLNSVLKSEFQKLVRQHVSDALENLTNVIRDELEKLKSDVNFDAAVTQGLGQVLAGSRDMVLNKVDGIVEQKAGQLDSLLVYKSKGFFAFFGGGNEIIDGLEGAARMFATELKDVRQEIKPEHMEEKTKKIRETLSTHYMQHVETFGEDVRNSVWPIVINEMHDLEKKLLGELSREYRTLLEKSVQGEVEIEYGSRRGELEARSKRFRQAIETLQESTSTMQQALSQTKAETTA
ncbi:dynamin family protein [Novipirellula aureliae]|uniref:dynamin family protein n=1 Tax=Novipirellula aureliae TaxID=2527966 RepID=UPI0018CF5E75|nr:dynamin family protein [Novipirellula aureliae]